VKILSTNRDKDKRFAKLKIKNAKLKIMEIREKTWLELFEKVQIY